jgi:SAM-dependent methyltransferase
MKTTDEMIKLNRKQAEFYDSIHGAQEKSGHGGYSENHKANWITRFWANLRYRQQEALKESGVQNRVRSSHEKWCNMKAGGSFLEIGCFSGSFFTFELAKISGDYLGVELSSRAVDSLNNQFLVKGLASKAKAQAVDFLTLESGKKFDLIYGFGVLHHFENPEALFSKIASVAKPGALLVFAEPSEVNSLYRIIRSVYRPLQSDAAWEWPFSHKTVGELNSKFQMIQGFGWGRWSLLLSILTGLPLIGNLAKKYYLLQVQQEVQSGIGDNLWNNSYVTAVCRLKD